MLAGDGEVDFVQGTARFGDDDWDGERLTVDAAIEMGYARFANGVHAYLVASGGYEFEATGTEGKLRTLSNGAGYSWRRRGPYESFVDAVGPEAPIESGTLRAIEDLVRAIDDDTDTLGGIELACRSQEMVLGMIASSREGGRRIELPLADRSMAIRPDAY
jgi:hypothetical protein